MVFSVYVRDYFWQGHEWSKEDEATFKAEHAHQYEVTNVQYHHTNTVYVLYIRRLPSLSCNHCHCHCQSMHCMVFSVYVRDYF
jgi:hypothetical protein